MKYSLFLCNAAVAFILIAASPAIAAVHLTAETNRPNTSTFAVGEPVEIRFNASGLAPGLSISLTIEVHDEYGKSRVSPLSGKLTADAQGDAGYLYPAPSAQMGYYEVSAKLADGTTLEPLGTRPAGFITYAVVPDSKTRADYGDKGSRFGMQGGFASSANVIPYLGVRYFLPGATDSWAKLEPKYPGQYKKERTEAMQAGKNLPERSPALEKVTIGDKHWPIYMIAEVTDASLPGWSLQPGTGGKINKMSGSLNDKGVSAFPDFASELAADFSHKYKNQKLRYYQMTWEPADGWGYGGTPANLVKLYALGYGAIHRTDPGAIVAGPTLFIDKDSVRQLNVLLDAGLGKYIDAFSLHPYTSHWPPEENGLPSLLREQLALVKKAVGHSLPFIGTEQGYTSADNGNLAKAQGDIRTNLIMLGEGASVNFGFYSADFWEGDDPSTSKGYGYYWNLNKRIIYGTDAMAPKIIVPAYAAMTYFLDGTQSEGPLTDVTGSQLGYRFKRNNSIITVVWDYASSSTYAAPEHAKICDWMGNCSQNKSSIVTVTGEPVYFIANKYL